MKKLTVFSLAITAVLIACTNTQPSNKGNDYPITAIPFTSVELTDNFWSKRIDVNRDVTIAYGLNKCEEEGRIRNFDRAAGLLEGDYEGFMPFDDTDVYKIIEGAAYSLQTTPDNKLESRIDEIIQKIAAAQEPDGYLTTWKTINPDTTPAWWVKPGPRWHDLGSSHELYNAGHLYEAAFAHYRATGKRSLLNVALKNADLIYDTFGPDKLTTPPGHQIIETGLIKLYRATGKDKYLDLARFFLEARGDSTGHKLYGPYSQDHKPVVEQDEAVGHAVRAVYMYAAITDIAALQQDKDYLKAADSIWENVVSHKIYITGGLGARREGEAFGENDELPNLTSYNETCAAIAGVYWNHRMFLLHGHSKYIDVLERTLYNGLISGVSLSGDEFFYPNCLESDGKHLFNQGALTRKSWFDCSCCPSNIIRFLPSIPDYIYAQCEDTLFVNLYMSNQAGFQFMGNDFAIEQKTNYPWEGTVKFKLQCSVKRPFTLRLRIPGWTGENPIPGDLYSYAELNETLPKIIVNGQAVSADLKNGYAGITREWSDGDQVELTIPMNVRKVYTHERVKANRGKVALERGPIVYCAEGADNGGKALDLLLSENMTFSSEYMENMLGGISLLRGSTGGETRNSAELTLIPYYAWAHRGAGEMAVWIAQK